MTRPALSTTTACPVVSAGSVLPPTAKESNPICTMPEAAFEPVGPVVPVEPVGRVRPGGPGRPVGPVAPVGPVGPVGPVTPVEPVAPVGPVGPVGPVAPVLVAAPPGPVTPVGPVAPVTPVGPVIPAPSPTTTPTVTRPMNRAPLLEPAICTSASVPEEGSTASAVRRSTSALLPMKHVTAGGDVNPPVTSAAAPASIVTVKAFPSPAPASVSPTTT